MTATAPGRPYRFAIRAYPPPYRARHGQELIDTAVELGGGRWSARQSASLIVGGLRCSRRYPRRFWPLAVLIPTTFGGLHLAVLVSCLGQEPTPWHPTIELAAFLAKYASIPCLPILAMFLAERVGDRPSRWRQAFALWAGLGLTTVLVVSTLMEPITRGTSSLAYGRLWPGVRLPPEDAEPWFDPADWTVTGILARELVVVAVIAGLAALALRHAADLPALGLVAVPVAVYAGLLVYTVVTPWAFVSDYDFFVGDAVLGGAFAELSFFFAPFDPIGSAALGLAALSMGGLLKAWGGPVEAELPDPVSGRRAAAVTE